MLFELLLQYKYIPYFGKYTILWELNYLIKVKFDKPAYMKYPIVRINVDRLLREKGLTKRELANFLEINETHINRKLNDRASVDFLTKISNFLECDIQDLVSGINITNNTSGNNNNVAGYIGGHAAIISTPANTSSKIINESGIEVTCDPVPDLEAQQRIVNLENEIKLLRSELEHKGETIEQQRVEIKFLRGQIEALIKK